MSAQVETAGQQDGISLKDALAQHVEKMMGLKLSKLKKLAKAKGIPDGEIEVAAAGAEDEDDAKHILINLLLKAQCMKATPTPTKGQSQQPMEDLHSQMCMRCHGCIRPPKHEGACMDGQCNDIEPKVIKDDAGLDVAAELARHKAVKEEVLRKVEDKAQKEAAAEKEEQRWKEAAAEKEAQRKALVEKAQRKAAEEEALRKAAEEQSRKKAAEEEALQKAVEAEKQRKVAQEEAERRAAEEEVARKAAEAEAEAAQNKAEEDHAAEKKMQELSAKRQAAEEADMATMDRNCIGTFLDTIRCEKIRTPLKGTILYTKHIRPNRPAGTSVDVKDSSFRCLGIFLKFLEDEGLLCLKPGLSDPVVTEICYGACRDYKYSPQSKPSAIRDATSDTAGYPVSGLGKSWQ